MSEDVAAFRGRPSVGGRSSVDSAPHKNRLSVDSSSHGMSNFEQRASVQAPDRHWAARARDRELVRAPHQKPWREDGSTVVAVEVSW